jgi:SAM-dependent methyltransferase
MEVKFCPACGAETSHMSLWRKNSCDVLKCTQCALGSVVSGSFDPTSYYTEAYFDGRLPDGYADYQGSEQIIRAEFRTTIKALRRFIPAGSLLEIGAAYGFFLLEARAYYDVRGVEMADGAAAYARGRGLDVRTGPVTPNIFEKNEMFDIIVMLDVIEHLENPAAILALCASHLRPGGVLLITTGDFQSIIARVTGKHWRLMTPPQHRWYFGRDNIAKIAARFGLTASAIEYPPKQVPLALILYQLGRMAGCEVSRKWLARFSGVGIPMNLFDAMRVIFQKRND